MRTSLTEKEEALYTTWARMKQRCNGTSKKGDRKNYIERGITYCPSWEGFDCFCEEMGSTWKHSLTLDRIDNDKGYSKENCRWATRKEQAINRRNTRFFEFDGEKLTLTDWANKLGVNRSTLAQRVYVYKWPIERALSA